MLPFVGEDLSFLSCHQLKHARKRVGYHFFHCSCSPQSCKPLGLCLTPIRSQGPTSGTCGDTWRATGAPLGLQSPAYSRAMGWLENQREPPMFTAAERGTKRICIFLVFCCVCCFFVLFFFLTCRSFKSSNSVMNIHFNVVLKIQLMTPQRENDPGIKEINI